MKKKIAIIAFLLLVIALFFVRLYIDANVIQISRYTVESNKIPESFDGYKIIHISDLHSKEFGENSENLLKKIEQENPDIVVLTGDMVTASDKDYTVFFTLVNKLTLSYDVYFIPGNHEQALSDKRKNEIKTYLEEHGVVVLNNEMVPLMKNSQNVNLYGLWYSNKYYSENDEYVLTEKYITELIGNADYEQYNILLTHNPRYFETYASWGADLILSGHIHGGMVRFPFIGAIFSPDEKFFPKYDAGLYQNDSEKSIIVSRGLGRGSTGFRLFNRPELVVITLQST